MANSAWSNDGVTTLVVPTGATSGRRIVIDGDTGEIDIYDASNNLIGILGPDGLEVLGPDGSEVHALVSGGDAVMVFLPAPIAGHTVYEAVLDTFDNSPSGPALEIAGPGLDAGSSTVMLVGGAQPTGVGDNLLPYFDVHTGFFNLDVNATAGDGGFRIELNGPGGGIIRDQGLGVMGVNYFTGGTAVTSVGATEVALTAWTNADPFRFLNGRIYAATVGGGAFSSVTSSNELAVVRLRSAVNSLVAQVLGTARVPVPTAGNVVTFEKTFYIKNVSGADIDKTSLGLTVSRTGAGTGNESLYGDAATANFPLYVKVEDMGRAADTFLSNIAVAIT